MAGAHQPLAARAFAGVAAAVLPPEHGGPEPEPLAREVARYLASTTLPVRWGALAGALAFHLEALAATRSTARRLPPTDRERVVARLAGRLGDDPVDALKALVLLVAGAGEFAAEIGTRAAAHQPVRPDPPLTATPVDAWPSRSRADAVVVGSGAGGAMVARTLARAGLDVVVVEEGRRHTVEEFRTRQPIDRFSDLYRTGAPLVALGRPPVVLPVGWGVGGTTLVNSGTCYRPPPAVLSHWSGDLGIELAEPGRLDAAVEEVEATIGVAPVPMEIMGRNGRLLLEGADRLGWGHGPLSRNAPGCGGCCQCAIGCPRNAKAGVHLNALPQACEAGARIVTHARVARVLHERGAAQGVLARRPNGSGVVIEAPTVVIAAGAVETPGLLRRSGIGRHPEIGRNLALHPALGAGGRFEEPVVAWDGVLQSAAVDEFHQGERILIEATSTPPGMGSMALPGVGRALLDELAGADHIATLGAMIGDGPWGRVRGQRAGQTVVTYGLPDEGAGRLLRAARLMAEVLFAAGATEVVPGIAGVGWSRSLADLDDKLAGVRPRQMHLAAFHPTGTARMGADPDRAPVDEWGRLRGTDGVWVADASVVPTCPDVNPQVTIMALALAIADGIVAQGDASACRGLRRPDP